MFIYCSKPFSRKDNLKKHIISRKCALSNTEKLWECQEVMRNKRITIQNIQTQTINNVTIERQSNEVVDVLDENYILNYIYILREREFIKTNEQIYKVGKTTKRAFKRFNQYPNGSKLEFMISVDDCDSKEKIIKEIFTSTFTKVNQIGQEYFEGNIDEMKDVMYKICSNKNQ